MNENLPEIVAGNETTTMPPELAQQQQYLQQHELGQPEIQEPIENEDLLRQGYEGREQIQPLEQNKSENRRMSSQEKNFAAMRQKIANLEKERDEAMRRAQEREEVDFNLGPDDIAEGKHLTRLHKELRDVKEQLRNYQQQTIEATTEARLKARYNDFDSVVNTETISALRDQHPELAATLQNAPDLYSQAVSAYTLIKKLGIVPESYYNNDKQRVQANAQKPRSSYSAPAQQGDTPLSRANAFAEGLTDSLKQQLLKEMNQSRKGY